MPFISVSIREGFTPEEKKGIADGIHHAMMETMGLPEDDYNQVFHVKSTEDMLYDPGYFGMYRSPKAIFIQLWFNHRPAEMKAKLFETIADNIVRNNGGRREDVLMMISETASENWWAMGRTIDEETGLDSRMSKPRPALAS